MKFSMNRSIASLGLALGALSFLPAANAALVEYTFVAKLDSGSLLGQSFSGSFSYDDASASTSGFGTELLFALSSFSFSFNGFLYGLNDLDSTDRVAVIDTGAFAGLSAVGDTFSMLPGSSGFPAFFTYDFNGPATTGEAGFGDLTYQLVTNTVPEPGTAGLLAVALLGIAGLRRVGQSATPV